MFPYLKEGDIVFFKKYKKNKSILKNGQIIIFNHPFKNKNLIGISLKQVLGNSAKVTKVTNDAKYIDSVKFLGFKSKMDYDVLKTYFDINVKMACIKRHVVKFPFSRAT